MVFIEVPNRKYDALMGATLPEPGVDEDARAILYRRKRLREIRQ